MKIRNKQTGEIVELNLVAKNDYFNKTEVITDKGKPITLTKLCAEWEDVVEETEDLEDKVERLEEEVELLKRLLELQRTLQKQDIPTYPATPLQPYYSKEPHLKPPYKITCEGEKNELAS